MSRLKKSDALDHWRTLADDMPLEPAPIPYKHAGSTYGADGVRIEGSRAFIDAVLGRLADLLAFENGETRLALNYQEVEARDGKPAPFAGNFVCYVKIHERGREARVMNAYVSALTGREVIASRGY